MGRVVQLLPMGDNGRGLIDDYSQYQRARGFSTRTITRRTITLRRFAELLHPGDFSTATDRDVQDFLLRYRNPRTRHAYRSDIRTFYTWAFRRGLLHNDPTTLIDPVKVPKSLPRPVPAALIPHLVMHAPTTQLRLMVALAAYAGLRAMEIAAISTDDVDLTHNVLIVRAGKGGKDRIIPLHPVLRRLLEPELQFAGHVFGVNAATVSRQVGRYLKANGLDSSCHKLRATFGTQLSEVSNGNIVMVQRLMGHESPTTTMAYVGWGGGEAAGVVGTMYDDCA